MFTPLFDSKEFAEKSRELEFDPTKTIQVECPIRFNLICIDFQDP